MLTNIMSLLKISVIIPTYKPDNYLWECLDSLRRQTFLKSDFEVVLILNGCREPYNERIVNYTTKADDILWHYVQIDVGGVSNARNIGLDLAKGEYITFVDDDDIVSETYLEELYQIAKPHVIPLCYPLSFKDSIHFAKPYIISSEYRDSKNVPLQFVKAKKYFSGPVYKLIHKEIIGSRRFNTTFTNGEDSLFMFLISDKFRFIAFTSKRAIYYRRLRSNSASFRPRPFRCILWNRCRLMLEYSRIYFSNIPSYNSYFYFTRIMGSLRTIVDAILTNLH